MTVLHARSTSRQGGRPLERVAKRVGPPTFSVREARDLVQDLFTPRPAVYWADFLVSITVAYGFAFIYLRAEPFSAAQIGAFLLSGLALFRAGTFIHEIVHMPRGTMKGFQIVWNVLCGIPLLMPSFLYSNHADHHNRRRYGTPADGEYLPLGAAPRKEILLYLAQVPILPLLAIVRFLLLTPLSLAHPALRRWVLERASSYASNPYYRRRVPSGESHRLWLAVELVCFGGLVLVVMLLVRGVVPWPTALMVYLLATYTIGLNWVRNLAAHRYRNDGSEMTHIEQLLDSINLPGRPWLTALFFPVGLRFHALHHLFPAIPYHSLCEAHQRLMTNLPSDSPYRQTVYRGFWAALRQLWQAARLQDSRRSGAMRHWRHPNERLDAVG